MSWRTRPAACLKGTYASLKFGIPAVAQKKQYMWEQNDIIVASMDTAKRDPHREIVLNMEYDMLIIDEAHERSLNIDFLLGYLRQLLPKRPDS